MLLYCVYWWSAVCCCQYCVYYWSAVCCWQYCVYFWSAVCCWHYCVYWWSAVCCCQYCVYFWSAVCCWQYCVYFWSAVCCWHYCVCWWSAVCCCQCCVYWWSETILCCCILSTDGQQCAVVSIVSTDGQQCATVLCLPMVRNDLVLLYSVHWWSAAILCCCLLVVSSVLLYCDFLKWWILKVWEYFVKTLFSVYCLFCFDHLSVCLSVSLFFPSPISNQRMSLCTSEFDRLMSHSNQFCVCLNVFCVIIVLWLIKRESVFLHFKIMPIFNSLKIVTLLVHAGLSWSIDNPRNSDMDYGFFKCVCTRNAWAYTRGTSLYSFRWNFWVLLTCLAVYMCMSKLTFLKQHFWVIASKANTFDCNAFSLESVWWEVDITGDNTHPRYPSVGRWRGCLSCLDHEQKSGLVELGPVCP